jgi:hypothetical protein
MQDGQCSEIETIMALLRKVRITVDIVVNRVVQIGSAVMRINRTMFSGGEEGDDSTAINDPAPVNSIRAVKKKLELEASYQS